MTKGHRRRSLRRRKGLIAAAIFCVPVAGATLLTIEPVATRAAAAAEELSATLRGRSPGERAAGALASTKPRRAVAAPHQRALSQARGAPAAAAPGVLGSPIAEALAAPVAAPLGSGVFAPAVAPLGGLPGVIGGVGGVPGGSVVAPPVGGGGGGGGGGGTTPPDTGVTPPGGDTPVAPIPEPATWLTMLAGFGLIGGVIRRRRGMERESDAVLGR